MWLIEGYFRMAQQDAFVVGLATAFILVFNFMLIRPTLMKWIHGESQTRFSGKSQKKDDSSFPS